MIKRKGERQENTFSYEVYEKMYEYSTKEFAKDYWELGATAISFGIAAVEPASKAAFELIGYGILGYCANILLKRQTGKGFSERNLRLIRDITFYMGAGVILDKNVEYMANLPELQKMALPAVLLMSSWAFDKSRSEKKDERNKSKSLEDKIK